MPYRFLVSSDGLRFGYVDTARSGDQVTQLVQPEERRIDDGFPLHARLVIDSTNTLRYLRAGDKGSIYRVEQSLE